MTVTLTLPDRLESQLRQEASSRGFTVASYAQYLLEQHCARQVAQRPMAALIQSWLDDDNEQEQQETGDYLIDALDTDRHSERKLFPSELEGVTW